MDKKFLLNDQEMLIFQALMQEDLIDSNENLLDPHTESKILGKLTITEEERIKNPFHIRKALLKL